VTQANCLFFERFPHRQHRIGALIWPRSSKGEIAEPRELNLRLANCLRDEFARCAPKMESRDNGPANG
jgi:hypothetical protein